MVFRTFVRKSFRSKIKSILGGGLIVTLVFVLFFGIFIQQAKAASLTALSDTQSRVKKNTLSNHTIRFTTPTGAGDATDTITITLPSDFTTGSVDYTDIDLSYGASTGAETEATLAATADGTSWGAAFAGLVLTLTHPTDADVGDIAAADKVIVEIGLNATSGNAQLNNPTTAASFIISIAGLFGDTGQIATAIVDDDQVVVSATIDPYLTFTISQTTVSLTKLAGGNPNSAAGGTGFNQGTANTLAAATNATSGYAITYYGATLTSGANTIDAMGTGVSAVGTEQFGINLKNNATPDTGAEPSGGSGAPSTGYGTADQYTFVASTTTPLAAAAAATASTTYTVSYITNVTATTQAGNYSTTITYICTGNF